MKKLLGKLKCFFGFHYWIDNGWADGSGNYFKYKCKRCNKETTSYSWGDRKGNL